MTLSPLSSSYAVMSPEFISTCIEELNSMTTDGNYEKMCARFGTKKTLAEDNNKLYISNFWDKLKDKVNWLALCIFVFFTQSKTKASDRLKFAVIRLHKASSPRITRIEQAYRNYEFDLKRFQKYIDQTQIRLILTDQEKAYRIINMCGHINSAWNKLNNRDHGSGLTLPLRMRFLTRKIEADIEFLIKNFPTNV